MNGIASSKSKTVPMADAVTEIARVHFDNDEIAAFEDMLPLLKEASLKAYSSHDDHRVEKGFWRGSSDSWRINNFYFYRSVLQGIYEDKLWKSDEVSTKPSSETNDKPALDRVLADFVPAPNDEPVKIDADGVDDRPRSGDTKPAKPKRKGSKSRGPYYKYLLEFMKWYDQQHESQGGIAGVGTRALTILFIRWSENRRHTFKMPVDSTLRDAVDQARDEIGLP